MQRVAPKLFDEHGTPKAWSGVEDPLDAETHTRLLRGCYGKQEQAHLLLNDEEAEEFGGGSRSAYQ